MKLTHKFAGLGAALCLLASGSANAIVTTWDYSVASLFTFAAYSNGSSGPTSTSILSWGTSTGQGQSSLSIGGSPASGAVDTYLGLVPPAVAPYLGFSTSLTHTNKPITGTSLVAATLTNTVVLNPLVPDQPALPDILVPFSISFTETPNSTPCAITSPTPCNDIFVLTSGLLNLSFDYDDGTGTNTYYVNIFPTTGGILSVLPSSACAAAGEDPGCIGFSTPEGQATTLAFGFTISTQELQIPEPGTLALIGLGLLGFFGLRRRG